jgi:predicted AAA+ superfamily ATPase
LSARLPQPTERRIVVITGARQTGKTTLARSHYAGLRYVNLDAIEDREALRELRTSSWAASVGPAILDEAQKEPAVFDKVKWAFDDRQLDFTVLLGSSRILLLDRVRETLAGRSFLYDLWPLMASELSHPAGPPPALPLVHRVLAEAGPIDEIFRSEPEVLLAAAEGERREAIEHLAEWGGMPGLLPLGDYDRHVWLRSYQQTFLERDLADLVRLTDLHPFRQLQRLCMLRSARLLQFSELARDAGLAATTARRYVEYLRISYQAFLLQPYAQNLTSGTVKTPKLYWLDLGLLRHGTRQWGPLTGDLFETLAVGEIQKWIRTMAPDTEMFFYRTRSGMEADLILETASGAVGVEIKQRATVSSSDARSLCAIAAALGRRWRGGIIVHDGASLHPLVPGHRIWAVPLHRLV